MRYINQLLIIIAGLMTAGNAAGQTVPNAVYCSRELYLIKRVLTDTAHTSFDALFILQAPNRTADTIHHHYQVADNCIHRWGSDSLDVIQNKYYNLVASHRRKTATLSTPGDIMKYVLHSNILEPSFYQSYISGRSVIDSAGYRKLLHRFKTGSIYSRYDIIYDAATYRIQCIVYHISYGKPETVTGGYTVNIVFSNYKKGHFTSEAFNTDPFFQYRNRAYSLVAPYKDYSLINLLNH